MRRALRRLGISIIACMVLAGGYLAALRMTGNFHEVIPGRYYRSAQLSASSLGSYIDRYGIKTVINLRGAAPGRPWYDAEIAAARTHGANHVDFAMSAKRGLSAAESFALVELLRNADGPVLVHCLGGADRTGLATVMYLQQIAGVDEETAEWQLSPIYGHLNLPFLGVYAMDDTWETFEKLIGLPS